ncbi:MAG: response regulator [Lentisphaerales bacterium]|nr:response regulator [Lentisphaerales bacterium]
MAPCVLIVDDEQVILEVLVDMLSNKGYLSETCVDGRSAFRAMNDLEFNLVILDLNLSDVNGLEVADYLEMHSPDTPIIFITGDYSIEAKTLREECEGRIDRMFINKPIMSTTLLDAVEKLLEATGKLQQSEIA